MTDQKPDAITTQAAMPQYELHADIPASLRINWFVITDDIGDHIWRGRWLEDALEHLYGLDVHEFTMHSETYSCTVQLFRMTPEKRDRLRPNVQPPNITKGRHNG